MRCFPAICLAFFLVAVAFLAAVHGAGAQEYSEPVDSNYYSPVYSRYVFESDHSLLAKPGSTSLYRPRSSSSSLSSSATAAVGGVRTYVPSRVDGNTRRGDPRAFTFGQGYGTGYSPNYSGAFGQGYGVGYGRNYFGATGQQYGTGYSPKY